MTIRKFITYFITGLVLCSCRAQNPNSVDAAVRMLDSLAKGGAVEEREFDEKINALSSPHIERATLAEALALGRTLIDNPQPKIQTYGAAVFLSVQVGHLQESGSLIEQYIPGLEQLIIGRQTSTRR